MAEDRFRDCYVSVDCGKEGLYQGEIEKLDSKVGELTLKKATRNGVPAAVPRVKIAASKIEDIRAYKKVATAGGDTRSVVVPKLPAKSAGGSSAHSASETYQSGEFRGCLVSVDCDELGYYQGKVIEVDAKKMTITLEAPLKNGFPVKAKSVELSSDNIADIKVVRMPDGDSPAKVKAKPQTEEHPSSTSSSSPPAPKPLAKSKNSKSVVQPSASTKPVAIQPKNKKEKESKKEPVREARQITIMKRAPTAKNTNQSYPQFSPGKKGGRHVPDGPTGIPSLDMANLHRSRPQDQTVGPSGIPSVDRDNGYTSRHPGGGLLEEPLDHSLLQKDFDSNLATLDQLRLDCSDVERTQDDEESSSD